MSEGLTLRQVTSAATGHGQLLLPSAAAVQALMGAPGSAAGQAQEEHAAAGQAGALDSQEAKCAQEIENCLARKDNASAAAAHAELVQRRSAPGHNKQDEKHRTCDPELVTRRRLQGSGRRGLALGVFLKTLPDHLARGAVEGASCMGSREPPRATPHCQGQEGGGKCHQMGRE